MKCNDHLQTLHLFCEISGTFIEIFLIGTSFCVFLSVLFLLNNATLRGSYLFAELTHLIELNAIHESILKPLKNKLDPYVWSMITIC